MSLEFLNQTPTAAFRKLERDLFLLNPKIDLKKYKMLTPARLGEAIAVLKGKTAKIVENSTYGSWLTDENYIQADILREALEFLLNHKTARQESETLVPNFTYYRGVKQFGDYMEGQRCYYMEDHNPFWMSFRLPVAVAKAFEVLRHGSEEDFKSIYIEMADGSPDAIGQVTLEHLAQSTPDALASINEYCDSRWTGAWPWETVAPYTLRNKIQENIEMRMQTLNEMKGRFDAILKQLNEGDTERFEMLTVANDMGKTVDNMISDLGKLSAEGIEAVAKSRTTVGDDVASAFETALQGPINAAAEALTQLSAAVQTAVRQIEGGGDFDVSGLGGLPGGDMGSPMDAMGADPMGGMGGGDLGGGMGGGLSGELADVSLDGEEGERPKKEL